jgi:hypothetical protein
MSRTARTLRPQLAATLSLAAALTAACSDGPIGPTPHASADAAPQRKAPALSTVAADVSASEYPDRIARLQVRAGSATSNTFVPGTTIHIKLDDVLQPVTDNVWPETDPAVGRLSVVVGISTSYKAKLASVPVGYLLPQTVVNGTTNAKGEVVFETLVAQHKPSVQVSFRNTLKQLVPGATITATMAGMDYLFTITDGGAGDLLADGSQGPADGVVTFWTASPYLGEWKICEQAPPTGYLLAEQSCQLVKLDTKKPQGRITFVHQTGIIAPPPEM